MGFPTYATVEQLASAMDIKSTSAQYRELSRLLQASSRAIENALHRHFYPLNAVSTYDLASGGEGFWLDADLQSLTAVTADDESISVGSVSLYPQRYGPPYSWVGIVGVDVVLTGVWGYSNDTSPAGALGAAITDTTGTSVTVTDASKVGIGDLLLVDSERLIVEGRGLATTGTTISGNLDALASGTTVGVGSGAAVKQYETITIDAERMLVTDIAGNNLIVIRGYDGSTLAAHNSGATVYAPRLLTVERAAVGTTAATHLIAAALVRNVPPGPISQLCIAEAIFTLENESAGYGRVVGSQDNEREASGRALRDLREAARSYARLRMAAV